MASHVIQLIQVARIVQTTLEKAGENQARFLKLNDKVSRIVSVLEEHRETLTKHEKEGTEDASDIRGMVDNLEMVLKRCHKMATDMQTRSRFIRLFKVDAFAAECDKLEKVMDSEISQVNLICGIRAKKDAFIIHKELEQRRMEMLEMLRSVREQLQEEARTQGQSEESVEVFASMDEITQNSLELQHPEKEDEDEDDDFDPALQKSTATRPPLDRDATVRPTVRPRPRTPSGEQVRMGPVVAEPNQIASDDEDDDDGMWGNRRRAEVVADWRARNSTLRTGEWIPTQPEMRITPDPNPNFLRPSPSHSPVPPSPLVVGPPSPQIAPDDYRDEDDDDPLWSARRGPVRDKPPVTLAPWSQPSPATSFTTLQHPSITMPPSQPRLSPVPFGGPGGSSSTGRPRVSPESSLDSSDGDGSLWNEKGKFSPQQNHFAQPPLIAPQVSVSTATYPTFGPTGSFPSHSVPPPHPLPSGVADLIRNRTTHSRRSSISSSASSAAGGIWSDAPNPVINTNASTSRNAVVTSAPQPPSNPHIPQQHLSSHPSSQNFPPAITQATLHHQTSFQSITQPISRPNPQPASPPRPPPPPMIISDDEPDPLQVNDMLKRINFDDPPPAFVEASSLDYSGPRGSASQQEQKYCITCMRYARVEEFPARPTTKLCSKHPVNMCTECLVHDVEDRILDDLTADVRCPYGACQAPMTEEDVRALITEPDILNKYLRILRGSAASSSLLNKPPPPPPAVSPAPSGLARRSSHWNY
ncbi:hypothetical protein T439DRAFT_324411 [Meredithblackwellia eburnea MCA 4105]